MALSLYRRHRRDCKAGHPEDSRSGEFEERKKNWKRCDCPIFVSGTLSRNYQRKSTEQWEWDPARVIAASWEKTGSWDGKYATPEPQVVHDTAQQRIAIADAIKVFLSHRESAKIAPATLRKYKTFTERLEDFAAIRSTTSKVRHLQRKIRRRSGPSRWGLIAITICFIGERPQCLRCELRRRSQ